MTEFPQLIVEPVIVERAVRADSGGDDVDEPPGDVFLESEDGVFCVPSESGGFDDPGRGGSSGGVFPEGSVLFDCGCVLC